MKKKCIGSVYVDSGQLIITDPCYLKRWKNNVFYNKEFLPQFNVDGKKEAQYSYSYEYSYDGACNATLSPNKAGSLENGFGVAFSFGYNDGEYPVFATYNKEGRIVKVEIIMGE